MLPIGRSLQRHIMMLKPQRVNCLFPSSTRKVDKRLEIIVLLYKSIRITPRIVEMHWREWKELIGRHTPQRSWHRLLNESLYRSRSENESSLRCRKDRLLEDDVRTLPVIIFNFVFVFVFSLSLFEIDITSGVPSDIIYLAV